MRELSRIAEEKKCSLFSALEHTAMNGVEAIISFIDDAGQVHLEGHGLALIPGVAEFTVIG